MTASIIAAETRSEAAGIFAQHQAENFPVVLRIYPRAIRRHLLAIYGFARLADDTGDVAEGDRLALLDELERDLDRVYCGVPVHPILQALAPTVRACALPRGPFRALIEANRRDQRLHRYATFQELFDYCALSANPVGRLVLQVFGAATPERLGWSDDVCTALQIVEHCQDVREDVRRGRVYLPQEDMDRFGCRESDLLAAATPESLRRVIALEVARSRALLAGGRPLIDSLRGWARLAVAGFVAGGLAAADAIERASFDVLPATRRPRRRDGAAYAARLLLARRWRR
jgi:squalene synthase HpnC